MIRLSLLPLFCLSFVMGGAFAVNAQDLPLPGKTLRNTAPRTVSDLTQPAQPDQTQDIQSVGQNLDKTQGQPIAAQDVPMMPPQSALTAAPVNATSSTANVAPKPALAASAVPPVPENIFYDSAALVPQTEMSRKGVPRKVNPRAEPASKYIVVRKNRRASSTDARLIAADRAMKLGRYDSAATMYDDLYAARPRDVNVLLGRATSYQHLGRHDDAMRVYEELLTIKPNFIEAEVNMLGLLAKKYPSVALERLLKLWENNSDNVAVAAQIAIVEGNLKRYNEAVRFLGIAAGIEPHNANHVFNMAVIADRAGATADAIRYYEDALEIDSIYGGGRTIPREVVFERLASLR